VRAECKGSMTFPQYSIVSSVSKRIL
jgi:hypothetical protein